MFVLNPKQKGFCLTNLNAFVRATNLPARQASTIKSIGMVFVCLGWSSGLMYPLTASGYTLSISSQGALVKWPTGKRVAFGMNLANSSGVSTSMIEAEINASLSRWTQSSNDQIQFDLSSGSSIEQNSEYNGTSSVYFTTADNSIGLDSSTVALTQVWYRADTGEVLEADVVLNDIYFDFTNTVTDTTGYGSADRSSGSRRKVFVGNVLTHEFGHALGLGHSDELQSAMLYMETPEEAKLACDDHAALRGVYGVDSDKSKKITGRVVDTSNKAVFGANVEAISLSRGTVLATAISMKDGSFEIGGLEAGSYVLFLSPHLSGATTLPVYFASATTAVCSGSQFSRSFVNDGSANGAKVFDISGSSLDAGSVQVTCNGSGYSASVSAQTGSDTVEAAPTYTFSTESGSGDSVGVFVDRFTTSASVKYFKLNQVTGSVSISSLSYVLYSPVDIQIRLLTTAGQEVGTSTNDRYTGTSGFVNYDAELTAGPFYGEDLVLEVTQGYVSLDRYPGGPTNVDSNSFFAVTARVGTLTVASSVLSAYATNARCTVQDPERSLASSTSSAESEDTGGSCLSVKTESEIRSEMNGTSKSLASKNRESRRAVSFFIPWIIVFFVIRLRRSKSVMNQIKMSKRISLRPITLTAYNR